MIGRGGETLEHSYTDDLMLPPAKDGSGALLPVAKQYYKFDYAADKSVRYFWSARYFHKDGPRTVAETQARVDILTLPADGTNTERVVNAVVVPAAPRRQRAHATPRLWQTR